MTSHPLVICWHSRAVIQLAISFLNIRFRKISESRDSGLNFSIALKKAYPEHKAVEAFVINIIKVFILRSNLISRVWDSRRDLRITVTIAILTQSHHHPSCWLDFNFATLWIRANGTKLQWRFMSFEASQIDCLFICLFNLNDKGNTNVPHYWREIRPWAANLSHKAKSQ